MAPATEGLKVTMIVQLKPAARLVPQVLVWEKFPLGVIEEIVSIPVPVFVNVTPRAALLVLRSWGGKFSLVGEKLTAGVPGAKSPNAPTPSLVPT
jgi:hypothetical protein